MENFENLHKNNHARGTENIVEIFGKKVENLLEILLKLVILCRNFSQRSLPYFLMFSFSFRIFSIPRRSVRRGFPSLSTPM